MKGRKPFLSLTVGVLACVIMAGCAGSIPQNGPKALHVAQFTVTDGVMGISYKFLLVASGGVQPYTWSITSGQLPPGLSLNSDGVISGTPTTLGKFNFVAQVVDSQSPTKAVDTLNASITINSTLTLPVTSLPSGTVGSGYNATITAANGLQPYSYVQANAAQAPLPPGLTMITTPGQNGSPNVATISGTPTAAGTYSFTVQANDAASEVATANFTITVVGRLQGPYVLFFNGFSDYQAFYEIAELTASNDVNGSGTISGTLDQVGPANNGGAAVSVAGTYNIGQHSNFGTMKLTRSDNGEILNFNIIVSSHGDTKVILENTSDSTVAWGSGVLKSQGATTVSGNAVSYSFGQFGNDNVGNRYAGVGMFALGIIGNGAQAVTGGEQDTNDSGTIASQVPITGGSVAQADPTNGRGTYSLTTASGTQNYVYYVVSQTELVGLDVDANGPFTLVDLQQQQVAGSLGTFSNASLTGQSILELDGVSSGNGGLVPSAAAGVVSFDGAGNLVRTDGVSAYYTDESDGGTLSTIQYATGTYSVDPTCANIQQPCGRVTVNLAGAPTQPVWYLVTTNQGFALDTNAGVMYGSLQAQSVPNDGPQGTPGFSIAALLGSFLGSTISPVLPSVTNELDVALTPCCGGIWAQQYQSSGSAGQLVGQQFIGAYDCGATAPSCDAIGTALGRFETTGPGKASTQISIIYVVGGNTGTTGTKGGLVGLNVANQQDGTPDPDPRITEYSR